MLREKEQELDKALSRLDEQEPLDVDEAVTTTAPLYKQSVSHHLLAYFSLIFSKVYKNADSKIYKISLTGVTKTLFSWRPHSLIQILCLSSNLTTSF